MDKVAEIKDTEIGLIVDSTVAAMLPSLEAKRAHITEVAKKTFQYGDTERHKLDIYYPPENGGHTTTRVLVWCYGGGFTTGERQLPPPADLIYCCVGAYFARQSFVTVIPDYRLAPHVQAPAQAEDVRDAIIWVTKNPQHLASPTSPNPDVKRLFVMGHSAGALNAFTAAMLLAPADRDNVAGLVLCAGAYTFEALDPDDGIVSALEQYWGSKEACWKGCPKSMLLDAAPETLASLPKVLMVEGEREPQWLHIAGDEFQITLEDRTGVKPQRIYAKVHNHISLNLALSTGEGEEWAKEVAQWIKSA